MRASILTLALAICCSITSIAEETETAPEPTLAAAAEDIQLGDEPLDLLDCVTVALGFNPRLVAANAQVRQAQAALTGARGADDPRLSLAAASVLLDERPSLDVQGMGSMLYGSPMNWDVGLKLQIPIYTSGKTGAYKDQASAMLDAAVARAVRERQMVARDTVQAYFGVLEARAGVEVAEGQVKALSAQHEAVSKMHAVGLVAKLDPLRVEVALSSGQEMLTKAENGTLIAMAALRAVMGLPREIEFDISGEYLEPELPAELEPAIDEALVNRPEVSMLDAYRRAAEAAAEIADAGDDPQLGLFAEWSFARDSRMPDTGRWLVGLGLEWNIFDGDQASSGEDQAMAQADRIEAEAQSLRDGITLQTTQAFLDLVSARDRVRTMEAATISADEAVELAAVGYANEVTPLTDLLAAEAARTKTKNDYVTAINDARIAMAELLYAMGR